MKVLLSILLLTIVTNASALDLSIDQINIGLTGEYEKAQADNMPVIGRTAQNGLDIYIKTTIGNTKANFGCVVGLGKESKEIAGQKQTLDGEYFICNYYVGLWERKF